MSTATPARVLESIVTGIREAAFATEPGNLAPSTWRFVIDNPWGTD